MVNPRQEWRVSCGHWVVIRTFAMPRAYLRSTKHVQNFKDPVIRSLRCMAGSLGAWRCVSLRYRGDGVVSIMSSVSASTECLARSQVHSISIILHPRLDILLQVNHSLGEPDFPPGLSALYCILTNGERLRVEPHVSCDETMSTPKYFAWNQPGTRRQSKPLLKAGSGIVPGISWFGPTNRCSQFF